MEMIEHILELIGLYKCHYCKKYIMPRQKFVGYFRNIGLDPLSDGKLHTIHATWFTHKGNCTEKDTENENNRI